MTGTDQKSDRNGGDTVAQRSSIEAEAVAAAAAAINAEAPVEQAATAERLVAAETEVARLKDEYLRALAETENVRRRAARDRQEAGQYAITAFARDLLSVADNLQRALASVDDTARAADPALAALTDGVAMTEKELLTVFERYGVKPIAADGQPFDPHLHEALYEVPNVDVPHGTVMQVAQTGYTLHDRTLRPARVGIAKGGPKTAAAVSGDDGAVVDFSQRNAGDAYRKRSESDTDQGAQVDRKT